jgi:peptidoglycan/LPS O-acetylase OafA/YrhL
LAGFSYTIYVIHYPLLLLAYSLLHPFIHGQRWAIAAAGAGITIAAIVYISASLSLLVENRPLISRWKIALQQGVMLKRPSPEA